jgi:pimeloyl-ACP methyl ester carboxylesterase
VAVAQLRAIQAWGRGEGERYAYLKTIHRPVLVINGHDDIMMPTINSFILKQELPNACLIPYPDSGHAALFQYSTEVAEAAARFLA